MNHLNLSLNEDIFRILFLFLLLIKDLFFFNFLKDRNPKLKSIPKLANDLQMIFQLSCRTENQELLQSTLKEMCEMSRSHCYRSRRTPQVFHQDLNCVPYSVSTCEYSGSQQIEQCGPGLCT